MSEELKDGARGRDPYYGERVQKWQLVQRRGLPLELKERMTLMRVRSWIDHWGSWRDVCVSFSGGLDSTVLLHLCRREWPKMPAVFVDTGLEYPEVRAHALAQPDVTVVRPAMPFTKVIEKYGYPVVSKRVAQYVHEARNCRTGSIRRLRVEGIRKDGSYSPMARISKKWLPLIDAPFKVSDRCCNVMKKRPADKVQKELGLYPLLGTRADEGSTREQTYYRYGCNAFDLKRPRSTPMAFWREQDIWEYIRREGLAYPSVYDMGYDRTGCMFCMFGVHLEGTPNRFQRMKETHPKKWEYCMNHLGCREVLEFIGVPSEPSGQLRMFEGREV